MRTPDDYARKAAELWEEFTENERLLVRFGIFPAKQMEAAEKAGYDTHPLVVALMRQPRVHTRGDTP